MDTLKQTFLRNMNRTKQKRWNLEVHHSYITPEILFNECQQENDPPLTIDIREPEQFRISHINRAINCYLTQEEVSEGYQINALEKKIEVDNYAIFNHRKVTQTIVIYGESDIDGESLGRFFAKLLHKENPAYHIFVLRGGFRQFYRAYPFMCDDLSVRETYLLTRRPFPNEILKDFMYLGGIREAMATDNLTDLQCSYVINLDPSASKPYPNQFQYLLTSMRPHLAYTDKESLWHGIIVKSFDWIEKARKEKQAILIHDRYGTDLAPALVIAFIMKSHNWTLEKAYNHTLARRKHILLSYDTWRLLAKTEFEFHQFSTVADTINSKEMFPDRGAIFVDETSVWSSIRDNCTIL